MSASLRFLLIFVCVACVGVAAYFLYSSRQNTLDRAGTSTSTISSVPDTNLAATGFVVAPADTPGHGDAPRTAPKGMKEYRNTAYNLSLFYPDTLSVKLYDEGKGAATITFQDAATSNGFQIFVVPYTLPQITTERFRQDELSGVMLSPLTVTIDGTPATSFYSTTAILGDTAEIWFTRKGFLYEVTAPKSQAEWLSGIMNTWWSI